jgi:hypothetical protein
LKKYPTINTITESQLFLKKADYEKWDFLTKVKGIYKNNIKIDWDKWADSDEEEEAENQPQAPSSVGNLGSPLAPSSVGNLGSPLAPSSGFGGMDMNMMQQMQQMMGGGGMDMNMMQQMMGGGGMDMNMMQQMMGGMNMGGEGDEGDEGDEEEEEEGEEGDEGEDEYVDVHENVECENNDE